MFTQNLRDRALFFQVWTTSGSEILAAFASSSRKSNKYLTAIGTASAPGAYPMGTWTPGDWGNTLPYWVVGETGWVGDGEQTLEQVVYKLLEDTLYMCEGVRVHV